MNTKTIVTVRMTYDKKQAIVSYAKQMGTTETDALIWLLDMALANLNRAEELKNLVDRRIDSLAKKQEFEAKRGLEILKNQAVNQALIEKLLASIHVASEEVLQTKNSAVSRFFSDLKGGKND